MLLLSIGQGHCQVESDKVSHFAGGAVVGAVGGMVAHELSDGNRFWTYAAAVGGSLLAGLVKEGIDKGQNGEWDNGDVAATVLGGITAGVTIDIFTGKKRRKKRQQLTQIVDTGITRTEKVLPHAISVH